MTDASGNERKGAPRAVCHMCIVCVTGKDRLPPLLFLLLLLLAHRTRSLLNRILFGFILRLPRLMKTMFFLPVFIEFTSPRFSRLKCPSGFSNQLFTSICSSFSLSNPHLYNFAFFYFCFGYYYTTTTTTTATTFSITATPTAAITFLLQPLLLLPLKLCMHPSANFY